MGRLQPVRLQPTFSLGFNFFLQNLGRSPEAGSSVVDSPHALVEPLFLQARLHVQTIRGLLISLLCHPFLHVLILAFFVGHFRVLIFGALYSFILVVSFLSVLCILFEYLVSAWLWGCLQTWVVAFFLQRFILCQGLMLVVPSTFRTG